MESFFSRYKNALVLMLVVLAQVVLLAMQVRRPAPDMPDGHNVRLWRYVVASVITPPERLAHNIGLSLRGIWSNYIYLRHLREQNQNLQAEVDRLRLEQASLSEDARAGQRLREMLDFRGRYIDKTVPAQVIGTSGTDQAQVIYIDRGYQDGLKVQMPVITPDGIIGKVKNVFPHTAQVLLISDQTSGTGVVLETTRIRGVMKGNASGQPQMINISPDERIQPGEPVVTSGGDQVYPPGMPVGVVDRVVADPDTSYVNVLIKPNADLAKLEEVLVVTVFSDKMPFAQEKDMAQSELDALAQKQRASDILSEKLPSVRDPNAPEKAPGSDDDHNATATADAGDPARPMRPPPAIHPDRYTPGQAPSAESLTPGAAPPGLHRQTSAEASASAVPRTPMADANAGGTSASGADRVVAPTSRFPSKLAPASTTSATPATAGTGTSAASAVGATATATGGASLRPPTSVGANPASILKPSSGTVEATAGTTAAGAVPGQARPSTTVQTIPPPVSRRTVIPAESADGILTPAGMGSFGGTPRPKPAPAAGAGATSASAGTAGNGSTVTGTAGTHPAAKPAAPKQQTQSPPPQQPATTPPGGV